MAQPKTRDSLSEFGSYRNSDVRFRQHGNVLLGCYDMSRMVSLNCDSPSVSESLVWSLIPWTPQVNEGSASDAEKWSLFKL